jgi:hypothetical protein
MKSQSKSAVRMRKWREKNRERQRETNRRWRKNNLKAARANCRKWYRKNRDAEIARNAQYYRDNKEAQAKRIRITHHGVTREWFDLKLIKQDNKCAICRKPFTRTPHIDHSHKCCPQSKSCSKCSRGLLCDRCNFGLGWFKDNIQNLSNAIQYLKEWNKCLTPSL